MNLIINSQNTCDDTARRNGMKGFSLPEIIIVLIIIAILSAISIPYIYNYTKLYKSEDQSLKVMDLMREANQLALTRRRTMRFEIDLTDNKMLIIDEDTSVSPAVHKELKAIPLEAVREIRMDISPTGISAPNPPNYNTAVFAADTLGHKRGSTTITGHNVWAARFKSDGSVVKTDGSLVSATIFVWAPLVAGSTNPRNSKEVRAITMFGGTGAVRYWKYDGATFKPF